MSDSALSPSQLDRLEDALEDLELEGIPSSLLDPDDDDARAVADTLEVYRSILVMSRQALPSEEVPAGLLDDVLARARRAAAAAPAPARAVPWWRRLGGWGPALAFGATAALLVVLVRPPAEEAPSATLADRGPIAETNPGTAEKAPELEEAPAEAAAAAEAEPTDDPRDLDGLRLAEAEVDDAEQGAGWGALGGELSEGRGAAVETKRRERKADVPAAAEPDFDDGVASGKERDAKGKRASTSSSSSRSKGQGYDPSPADIPGGGAKSVPSPKKTAPAASGGAPGPAPQPPAPVGRADDKPTVKEEVESGWADITTGDAKRRAGACSSARTAYERAVEDDSAEVRARAFAGLGLCQLEAGNASTAEGLFAKAKSADPKVEAFIAAERSRHEAADQASNAAPQADEAE